MTEFNIVSDYPLAYCVAIHKGIPYEPSYIKVAPKIPVWGPYFCWMAGPTLPQRWCEDKWPSLGIALEWMGVTKPISSFVIFFSISESQKCCLWNIAFIFDRCHRSLAAATPVKYKSEPTYLMYTFVSFCLPIPNGENNERIFSNPHPLSVNVTFSQIILYLVLCGENRLHYNGVIMGAMASQITSLKIVYSTICSGSNQRNHQSSASLAFVRGIHRWPVNSPHKGPVTRTMLPSITSSWGQELVISPHLILSHSVMDIAHSRFPLLLG